ncbi:phosphatase PAP2 family protein [Streptomyces sp. N2-109]|uniref:Phosphatase PAP2 family protein n=1 Tax=Streptomyces gossypii TaxID=2883101 RepID=A0ABT2JTH7_9ACTN|nr:phosphatase PAP2 family protein [Streptomyces gossypii]MCT2591185.1 phosphatase PAP2 family protein [Streptomyces gossypii]
MHQGHRPRWWTELPVIILIYSLYSAGRLLARGDASEAVDHGLAILRLEQDLRLNFEHPLNRLFTAEAWLGIPSDYIYATLHYLVTPAVLVWVWKRHHAHYRALRSWLMTSTLIGLVGFILYPTCPPRLLDAAYGFTDTMAQYGDYGWWGAEASAPQGLGGLTNEYAAMPSLHVGWALWCGVALWRYGRPSPWLRVLAVAYPLCIVIVVMGTANHYFLDAAAGVAVMGLGAALARPAIRGAEALRIAAVRVVGVRAGMRLWPGLYSSGSGIVLQRGAQTPRSVSSPEHGGASGPADASEPAAR